MAVCASPSHLLSSLWWLAEIEAHSGEMMGQSWTEQRQARSCCPGTEVALGKLMAVGMQQAHRLLRVAVQPGGACAHLVHLQRAGSRRVEEYPGEGLSGPHMMERCCCLAVL